MKHFQRITINDMQVKKASSELEDYLAEYAEEVSNTINTHVTEVMNELGYNYNDNMTIEEIQDIKNKMDEDGVDILIDDEMDGETYKVAIKVVQTARVIEFKMGGVE